MTIEDMAKKLRTIVVGMVVEDFDEKVDNIYKNMNDVHKQVRREMINYLNATSGVLPYPNVRTGNLIKKLAQSGLKDKAIKKRKVGMYYIYQFSSWLGIDNDGIGQHTVTTKDGRDAPYAWYLNTSTKLFKPYNNFFDKVDRKYRDNFKNETEILIDSEFKGNIYRY